MADGDTIPDAEVPQVNNVVNDEDSNDLPVCRICWGSDAEEDLIKPCNCEGTGAYIHLMCLEEWLSVNTNGNCVVCQTRYLLPTKSRIRRWVKLCLHWARLSVTHWFRFGFTATLLFMILVTILARPLGLMMWFVFSASATDPFDSPMFLYLLKARETWNDVEFEVDAALQRGPLAHQTGNRVLFINDDGSLTYEDRDRRGVRPAPGEGYPLQAELFLADLDPKQHYIRLEQHQPQLLLLQRLVAQHYTSANMSCDQFKTMGLRHNSWSRVSFDEPFGHPFIDDIVSEFVNSTCGQHSLFRSPTQFRYCQCGVTRGDASGVTRHLSRQLRRQLATLHCPSLISSLLMPANSEEDDVLLPSRNATPSELLLYLKSRNPAADSRDKHMINDASTTAALRNMISYFMDGFPSFSVVPSRRIMDYFLPVVYPRFRAGLVYIKYSPHAVNWDLEPRNPRFYGFPLGVRNDAASRQFVIKSLDLHFCITLICGIFIDLFLFARLWYSGGNPLFEGPWSANGGGADGHDSAAGLAGANGGTGSGSFAESWAAWLSTAVESTKTLVAEQWDTLVVISVVNYEVAKAWWYSSAWTSLVYDCAVIIFFLAIVICAYSYAMTLVSIVILKTFEADVLVY